MSLVDLERKAYIFEQLDYKPHDGRQQAIHDSDARFKALACGRRYGKTTFGARELTAAMCDPYDPGRYWIVGPKYTLAEKEFRIVYFDIMRTLGFGNHKGVKKSYNLTQGNMSIEMPWGSVLEVKSAQHQDTLLGDKLKGVIMAEAARHTSDTWEQYVRPALSDEKGWAIFTSTPRGYNWFQGLWMLGQDRATHPWYESWRLPSWENRHIFPGGFDDPEIQEMKERNSPQYFAQEIAAEFTAFTGKIYDEFDPSIHVYDHRDIPYNPAFTNVWALDYGWSNEFVCLDVMIDAEDNMYVWREYMKSEVATMQHADILMARDHPTSYHVDWGAGDPRGPDQASTISQKTHVQIYSNDVASNSHESWVLGVEQVKQMLKVQPTGLPKLRISNACPNLIRQMDQLHALESKEDKNAVEGQHKYDDHGPDALRYLVGQYFLNGAGSSLGDIYRPGQRTEAATFFQTEGHMSRYGRY
jgi:hypothetical protein